MHQAKLGLVRKPEAEAEASYVAVARAGDALVESAPPRHGGAVARAKSSSPSGWTPSASVWHPCALDASPIERRAIVPPLGCPVVRT